MEPPGGEPGPGARSSPTEEAVPGASRQDGDNQILLREAHLPVPGPGGAPVIRHGKEGLEHAHEDGEQGADELGG